MTRWLEQKIGPLHHPFCVPGPVAVESVLHPFGIAGATAALDDTFQINVGTAGGIVRSLAGERIVKHNGIGHPENLTARRKRRDGLANRRGKTSCQNATFVGKFDIAAPLRLTGKKGFEDLLAAGKMLSGRLDVSPAIHRPTGNAFEHHDLACAARGQRGKDKILADIRNHVETHRRIRLSGAHLPDISQSQAALWFGEWRALAVAWEQLSDGALPAGDDHQIMAAGTTLEIINIGGFDPQHSPALLKLSHPAGDLEPLVYRLRVVIQSRRPVHDLAANRIRHRKTNSFDLGTFLLPVVQAEIPLRLKRGIEHALA